MRSLACLSLAVLTATLYAQTYIGPDTITGGFTGRISAIACHPTNPELYYVGGADGGVWKTTNGGASWTAVTDNMPTTAIGAITTFGTSNVYVGTGEANYALHSRYGLGLYRSQDSGATWTHLAEKRFAGRCFSKIVINPRSGGATLYAGITPAGGFPEKSAAKGHVFKDGAIGVFMSADWGASWIQLTNGLPNEACTDLAIDSRDPKVLYAAIGRPFGSAANGIYKSTNAGASWTKLTTGLPVGTLGRIGITISPVDSQRLYALITNPCTSGGANGSTMGAFVSTNAGLSWHPMSALDIQSSYGWYQCLAVASPSAVDQVFLAGLSLVRSNNAGNTYSTVTPPHVDIHAITFDAAGRLLVGCDGGVYRSIDNGANWTSLNNGIGVMQLYAGVSTHLNQQNRINGGFQDNGTNMKTGAGLSWTHTIGGDGGWTAWNQVSTSTLWGQTQGPAQLQRSDNLGGAFSLKSTGINAGQPVAFYTPVEYVPGSSTNLLCATDRIYRSTNSGDNWSPISGDLTNGSNAIRSLAIHPLNPNHVMVATTDGDISRSLDGGATFADLLTGIPGWVRVTREIVPSPVAGSTWYLAVSQFGTNQIRMTANNGTSWTSLDGDLPDVPVNTIGFDPRPTPMVLYAGTDRGLYRSVNNGINWVRLNGIPNVPVIDIRYRATFGELIIATQGRGVYRLSL